MTTNDKHKVEMVVCVTTKQTHMHIASVGVGGRADSPRRTMTVGEVLNALAAGDVFYTVDPDSGKVAVVRKDTCKEYRCTVQTVRSGTDAVSGNNFDS